jgi:hypothetical protein
MDLAAVASYFDRTICTDTFTWSEWFYGQLDLFDDSRRDGATVVRRILSVAPDVIMPARRVLTIHDEQWLVGTNEFDSFQGSVIRDKYVLHRADGECTVQTVAQALSTGGTATYAGKVWIKDAKEPGQSSTFEGFFNLYLPPSESVEAGQILGLGGRLHLARNCFVSVAGFLAVEVDELPVDALVSGTFIPRAYAPLTDLNTSGTPVTVNVLRLRWQNDYAYPTAAAEKFAEGDIKGLVRKAALAAPAKPNDLLTLPDGSWQVVAIADEDLCWGLHLRRAGT